MGILDYVKQAEQAEKENLSAIYLANIFAEAEKSHESFIDEAKVLKKEIEEYKDRQVAIERQQWEHYTNNLKAWARKHGLKTDSMEAGMTEPNKPHYERANND